MPVVLLVMVRVYEVTGKPTMVKGRSHITSTPDPLVNSETSKEGGRGTARGWQHEQKQGIYLMQCISMAYKRT